MASQTNSYTVPEVVIGYPMQTSSAIPPRRGWWSRPIVSIPPSHVREATFEETMVWFLPCWGGMFTSIAILVLLLHFINHAQCHAKFTIQSIAVSPSSPATWHIDFLVKNPSSRYSIDYGSDETAVILGRPLNAAVLNTYYERKSRSHTVFSVDFVAEGNSTDAVLEQLDITLSAKRHKIYRRNNREAGLIDISCHNLTRSHEKVEEIQCHSSFTNLKILDGKYNYDD